MHGWSPDGDWIAYDTGESAKTLMLVRSDGTDAHEIGRCTDEVSLEWSPDAQMLISACSEANMLIPVADPAAAHRMPLPIDAAVQDWQRVAP